MKKITLLFAFVATTLGFSQATHTIDFETPGVGADWAWSAEEIAPLLSIVANPDPNVNTSATVVKFETYSTDNPWALTVSDGNGEFTFDATNAIVKIMVHKPVASDVGIKFEGSSAAIQLVVANTVINGWQELTFDFSAQIGNTYNRIVLIPDFAARTQTHVNYFDNLQLPQGVVPAAGLTSLVVDFETATSFAADGVGITYTDLFANDLTTGANSSATVGLISGINSGPYSNAQLFVSGGFDMSAGDKGFSIMVKGPRAIPVIKFKLEGGAANEKDAAYTTPGVWQELTFDFTADVSVSHNKIVIFFDFATAASADVADDVFMFDNVTFDVFSSLSTKSFAANTVKMYPNPAKGFVNFSSTSNDVLDVAVYDMLGKQVLRANAVQSQLNISSLNPGMYFVNMTQGSNVSTKKLLVN